MRSCCTNAVSIAGSYSENVTCTVESLRAAEDELYERAVLRLRKTFHGRVVDVASVYSCLPLQPYGYSLEFRATTTATWLQAVREAEGLGQ